VHHDSVNEHTSKLVIVHICRSNTPVTPFISSIEFFTSGDMLSGTPFIKIWIDFFIRDHVLGIINNAKPMLVNGSAR